LRLIDLDQVWGNLLRAEAERSKDINAKIRQIKEELRKRFAELVNSCERNIQVINAE